MIIYYLYNALAIYSSKTSGKGKKPGKGGTRFWKNVGLGFKTPREAIEGMDSNNLLFLVVFDMPLYYCSVYPCL